MESDKSAYIITFDLLESPQLAGTMMDMHFEKAFLGFLRYFFFPLLANVLRVQRVTCERPADIRTC